MPPPINLNDFNNILPYDAQYVGSYQPLLGWVGANGKRKLRDDVGKAVSGMVDKLQVDTRTVIAKVRAAGDGLDASSGEVNPLAASRALFSPWLRAAGRFVGLAPTAESAEPGLSGMLGRLFNREPRTSSPTSGTGAAVGNASATPADLGRSNAARIFALARSSPAFQDLVAAGAERNEETYRLLVKWLDEFDFSTVPDARLLLSPIGLLHLYREYYYDFGTFLGPSLEHIWIAPRSEIEMREVYSRTDYRFRELETTLEERQATEEALSEADEFSEQVLREKQTDLSAGVTSQGGANFEVWNIGGSSSFNLANSRRESKQQVRKITREKSSKVASEMKRSLRSLSRESTEVRRESSRLHRISNPSDQLINFEMRRKLQNVGVQMQHLGTQLCWQVYVGHPGDDLGLAELVHIAKPEDFENTPPPNTAPPALEPLSESFVFRIPFQPVRTRGNTDTDSDPNATYNRYGNSDYATKNGDEPPERSGDVIQSVFRRHAVSQVAGYELVEVRETNRRGTSSDHDEPSEWVVTYTPDKQNPGDFVVALERVNFEKQPDVEVTVECVWQPSKALEDARELEHKGKIQDYDRQMQRQAHEILVQGVRERVDLARGVRARFSDDLRAEERTIIYRRLLAQLLPIRKQPDLDLLSERVRAIFDVERMLYFVAPDWWRPNKTSRGQIQDQKTLAPSNRVRFGGTESERSENYLITERSEPAPLGASLGWLLQLDGDDRRNAFLNSPWVKAVLPIIPGRERAAIEWLRQAHVEGHDGLDAEHVDGNGRPTGETVEQRLLALAREVAIQDEDLYAAGQRVYETGFRAIDGTVRLTGEPLEVFAQWVEVVPTRQIVPVPYNANGGGNG
jgi:hypothetical protein